MSKSPLSFSASSSSSNSFNSSRDPCEMSLCILKKRDPECQVLQHNGQRIFIPSISKEMKRTPPKGTEVFVGNLPRDLYEDELEPLFSLIGPIYKLRLMMDFTGSTRGYAFVSYFNEEDAIRSVCALNGCKIRRNTSITVHLSVDNCRLFFGNIPRNLTADQVRDEFEYIMDGLTDVITYNDPTNLAFNRGFVFVEFESHAMAAIARRKLLSGIVTLWGETQKIFVDWADPEPMVDPKVLMEVRVLFLKNLPAECRSHRLKHILGNITNAPIDRLYKKCNYAFVHFQTRLDAEKAKIDFNNDSNFVGVNRIKVEWARPVTYSKKFMINVPPTNLCLSVPPKQRKIVLKSRMERVGERGGSFETSGSDSFGSDSSSDSLINGTMNSLVSQFQDGLHI